MTRRGATLFEIHVQILVLTMVLGAGGGIIAALRPETGRCDPAAIDRVCDRLRAELADGATLAEDGLATARARWSVIDGRLCRDRVAQLDVTTANWRRDGAAWLIALTPRGRIARSLRVVGPDLAGNRR